MRVRLRKAVLFIVALTLIEMLIVTSWGVGYLYRCDFDGASIPDPHLFRLWGFSTQDGMLEFQHQEFGSTETFEPGPHFRMGHRFRYRPLEAKFPVMATARAWRPAAGRRTSTSRYSTGEVYTFRDVLIAVPHVYPFAVFAVPLVWLIYREHKRRRPSVGFAVEAVS